jgi:hypothetical protein
MTPDEYEAKVDISKWDLDVDDLVEALSPLVKIAASQAIEHALTYESSVLMWANGKISFGFPLNGSDKCYWDADFLDVIRNTISCYGVNGSISHQNMEDAKAIAKLMKDAAALIEEAISKSKHGG